MAFRTGLDYTGIMKYIVILFLLFIVYSLGAAAYFMLRDGGASERMVRALTVRVALSVTLFLLLMAGIHFGFITGKL
ncbi:MAG TPA: twin transmembrane helix small protein [Burkholderiales bacterium]|nr:twin transmembrane helix small protein [Burkholderiales bacterium]